MVKDTDTSWIEADAWNDDDVGDNGEGIIPMSSLASIESYLLQLKGKAGDNDVSASTGDPSRAKVLAAQALGSLDTFLPKSLKADTLRAATDLGVWDALSAAVYSGFDVSEVEDACVIAMAQLLVPPPPENFPSRNGQQAFLAARSRSSPVARKLLEHLIEPFALGQLTAVLQTSSNSRALLSVARIATLLSCQGGDGSSGPLNGTNDGAMLRSPLPRAILSAVALLPDSSTQSADYHIRDSVACSLASIHLASASPLLLKHELNLGLFAALSDLYQRSISPGNASSNVGPADIISMVGSAAKIRPQGSGQGSDKKTALLLSTQMMEGGVPECLMSYAAIEAGSIKYTTTSAAFKLQHLIGGIASRVKSRQLSLSLSQFNIRQFFDLLEAYLSRNRIDLSQLFDHYDQEGYGYLNRAQLTSLMKDLLPKGVGRGQLLAFKAMLDVSGTGRIKPSDVQQAASQASLASERFSSMPASIASSIKKVSRRILTAPSSAISAFDFAAEKGGDSARKGRLLEGIDAISDFLSAFMPDLDGADVGNLTDYLEGLGQGGGLSFEPWRVLTSLHGADYHRVNLSYEQQEDENGEEEEDEAEEMLAVAGCLRSEIRMLQQQIQDEEAFEDPDESLIEELRADRQALKKDYSDVRSRGAGLLRLVTRLEAIESVFVDLGRDEGSRALPTKIKACPPNLPILKSTIELTGGLCALPAPGADKDGGRESIALTLEMHSRLVYGGMLPACLRLSSSLSLAGELACQSAILLCSALSLPTELVKVLSSFRAQLVNDVASLNSLALKLNMRLSRTREEMRKVGKALVLAEGQRDQGERRTSRYIPLNESNCMSPNVDKKEVAARADDLVDEEETIAMAIEEIQSVLNTLMTRGRSLDSALLALSESFERTVKAFPEVDKASSVIEAEEEKARRTQMDKGLGDGEVADHRNVLQLGPKLHSSKKDGKASKSLKRPLLSMDQSGSIPIIPLLSSLMKSFVSPLALPLPLVASALEAYLTGQASTPQQAAASAMAKSLLAEHMLGTVGTTASSSPAVKGRAEAAKSNDAWPPTPSSALDGSPGGPKAKSPLSSGSNYALIQFTHSPLRGKAIPSNQPRHDYDSPAPQAPSNTFGVRGGTAQDLISMVDEALGDIRGSQMMAMVNKTDSDEGQFTFGEALIDQADQVSKLLLGLVRIKFLSSSIAKQTRLLPASVSYDHLDPEQVNRWAPYLAKLMSQAIQQHPEHASQVADTIARLSLIDGAMGAPDEFDLIFVESGLLPSLISLLSGPDSDPTTRPSTETLKAQAAASHALAALASLQPLPADQNGAEVAPYAAKHQEERQRRVFESISEHDEALTVLIHTCLDHSLDWHARLASADLLASMLAAGGKASERASKLGAFYALLDLVTKDTYPFMRQDSRGGKVAIVKSLTTIAIDPEALSMIAEHSKVGSQEVSPDAVLSSILKSLWGVIEQLVKVISSSRHVNKEMIRPLMETSRAAADGLNQIIASEPLAVDIVKSMKVSSRISAGFLQAVKDADLVNSLLSIKASVSNH